MSNLLRDIRYSVRRCLHNPGFSLVAILSIAIGVGANTAIFTMVSHLLLSPPPYRAVEELVQVYPANDGSVGLDALSYPEVREIREASLEVFEGVATTSLNPTLESHEGSSEVVAIEVVSGNYFQLHGIEALLGRTLEEEDDRALDAHPVVVISSRFWKRRFGGATDVIGKSLRLNSRDYTILGLFPRSRA